MIVHTLMDLNEEFDNDWNAIVDRSTTVENFPNLLTSS